MSESDLSTRITLSATKEFLGDPALVGESPSWKEALRLGEIAARRKCATLILGEVGTGKRSLAHFIHQVRGGTDSGCWVLRGGTDDERILSNILGSTGADPLAIPWDGSNDFSESFNVGTLLIADVDLLTSRAQSQLLEILILSQAAAFDSAVAGHRWPLVVSTSQQDLRQMVMEGRFREDLFWRLSLFLIELAPLRRRVEDIEPLVEYFLKIFAELYSRVEISIERAVFKVMIQYSWPGNIIELQNYLHRAIAGTDKDELTLSMFPAAISGSVKELQQAIFRPSDPQSLIREFVISHLGKSGQGVDDLHKQIVGPVEKELIQQVMELCNHTQTKAAAKLGINRNTLYKKIVEYGLNKAVDKAVDKTDGGN